MLWQSVLDFSETGYRWRAGGSSCMKTQSRIMGSGSRPKPPRSQLGLVVHEGRNDLGGSAIPQWGVPPPDLSIGLHCRDREM